MKAVFYFYLAFIFSLIAVEAAAQGTYDGFQAEPVEPQYLQKVESGGTRIDMRKTLVFSAGIHKFQDDHLHPGRQAVLYQDVGLIKALLDQGVDQSKVVQLLDDQATAENCRSSLARLAVQAQPGDTLFLIMHSHGSAAQGGHIATYETGGLWAYSDMIRIVEENFKGSRVCICLCACHSGSLLDTIRSAPRRLAYFCLTSVHDDVNALTVATADFEVCLKDAFSGSACPDINHDGVITFRELGRYVTADQSTLFGTIPDFGWTPGFDPQMIVTNAQALEGPADCCLVRLRDGEKGRVVRQRGNKILVRGSKNPNLVQWVNIARARPLRSPQGGE